MIREGFASGRETNEARKFYDANRSTQATLGKMICPTESIVISFSYEYMEHVTSPPEDMSVIIAKK